MRLSLICKLKNPAAAAPAGIIGPLAARGQEAGGARLSSVTAAAEPPETPVARSPRRATRTRLACAAGALLASALAAEGLVRACSLAPEVARIQRGRFQLSPNPRLGYEPVPLDYRGDELAFHDYRGASNRLGYRDRDHQLAKPEGTYRIVVLGDSIGAGLRVERYEDTFPAILEASLLQAGHAVEVLNFSVSGYNTRQEVETLEDKALAYDPDLVLLQYCLNDRAHDDGYILGTLLEQELASPGLSSARLPALFQRSALLRMVRYRILPHRQPELPADLAPYLEAVAGDTSAEALRELGELSRNLGFEVLVALFPAVDQIEPYAYASDHRWVSAAAAAAQLPFLDLLPSFQACQAAGQALGHDIFHPTAAGHRCAALALAREIGARLAGSRSRRSPRAPRSPLGARSVPRPASRPRERYRFAPASHS
jgi:lysophospholipase L1-like esterase